MADFDPDKYLAADAPAFDPDAYLGNPEPADHGLSERLKRTPLENAVGPVTDYWPTYQRMNREGRETMSHGVEQIGKGEFLKGIGNTALGAAEYVGSPINAAYRTVVGQPIEDVTGIPREYTEFGAQMLTPGLGFTKMPGAKPPVPRIAPKPEANGPLGVTLSEGQATRDMDAIRRESAARTGQLGPGAEKTAQDFAAQQAEEVARARETVERSLDPAGGQQLAEGPYEAAEMAGNSFRREAAREKAGVTAAYDEAKALPGEVPASGVVGMGNLVRNRLPESVIIDPQLTPAASKMIDAIDETISKLRIPNKAELNAPDPMEISGVTLRGLDQVRKKLSEYRRAAYANNPTDGRAASAILDAYDAHIDHLVNSGQFSGDPRAVKAWNAARAAHSDYMKTFGKQANDPVGRVIQKIIGDKTNPPETANALADHLFGASGVNPSDLNIRVAQRMKKVLGENSPEWAAVRQGLFSRLVEPNGAAGATKIYKRIDQFLNRDGRDLANVLFTPEQRKMIGQYGDLHRALEVPKGGYNHSETSTFLAPILHKLNGAVSAVLGSIIGHTIAPGAHGLGEGIGAVIANRGTEAVKNFKNARQIVEQMPILERQIREWKKEAARTFNNQNRTSGSALASRTALVSKSLERMGVDGSYLLEHLQGTVPSAAGDQVQGQGRRNDQPDQGKTGKAHGGSVSRSVITDHVRRAFAGGGDVYDEVAPDEVDPAAEAQAAREAAASRLRVGVASEARQNSAAGVNGAAGLAMGFAPGSGIADAMGVYPDLQGGFHPSIGRNMLSGNYADAGLQGLGLAGDMMMAVPALAPLGAMAKAPRAASRAKAAAKAVEEIAAPAREYPLAPRGEWWGDANFEDTGGTMKMMTPDEFLARGRPLKIDEVSRGNIDDLKRHIEEGKTLDPLSLYSNGREDGRHRANAAKELGIEQVPVLEWPKEQPPADYVDALTVNSILHPEYPAQKAGSRNVEDIARELRDRGSDALKQMNIHSGRIEGPDPHTDEILSRAIASEIGSAINRGGKTAANWYTGAIDEAMQHAATLHPELKDSPHQKMGFTSALAVTSQGEAVQSNVRLAEQAYRHFRETGRFPTNIAAKNGPAMNSNFQKLNALLDELGPEGTREFLHREFTVKELKQMGYDVGGENMQTKVYGSAILGPKIGQGFYQNLNGNYNPVTMDLWFMRSWGRLTGTLVGRDIEKPMARLQAAMGPKAPKTPEELATAANDIVKQHEKDFKVNRKAYDSGEKKKSELTYAAERFLKNYSGVNEQPTSGAHRQWMRDRVNRAREILGEQGHHVTNADLQAIWWYPEKDLYAKLGGRDSEKINTDYASAFRELAERRAGSGEPSAAVRPVERAAGPGPDNGRKAGKGSGKGRKESDGQEVGRSRGGATRHALQIAYDLKRAS